MVAIRGAGWGLAPCLVNLVEECDEIAPNRSTVSDGSIGDPAHAARVSDHNPDDGWVCAVDITDDKANGCDADLLARHIVARQDPRVKYVIWNNTIAGPPTWTPRPYTGINPHTTHTHVSVHNTAEARNDLDPWWPQLEPAPPTPPPEDELPDYKIVWIKASGKRGAAYRVLFAKGKDGKPFPAMAFDIDSGDLDGWRKRLEEVPSTKPLPPSPYIRIVDGPYKNV